MADDYRRLLEQSGCIVVVPTGFSMWPLFFSSRDSAVLEKPSGRLAPGDVALYQRANGMYVIHRVVSVQEDGYTFRGDSQRARDNEPGVREGQVIGVMTGFYRREQYYPVTDWRYRLYRALWRTGDWPVGLFAWGGRLKRRLQGRTHETKK